VTLPSAAPQTRSSCATALARLAAKIVAASVSVHPKRTPRTTTSGLKTPKAAATTCGSTWPSNDPRLVKYAGPSGAATSPNLPGLGANPSFSYAACASGAKNT